MSKLFETTTIRDLRLQNRFVRSATWEGMAGEDGACTPRLIEVMSGLAHGGVGLIITGFAYVQKRGQAVPWMMGCHDDCLLPGLTSMTSTVHQAGGRIALQIAHGGVMSSPELTGEEQLGAMPLTTDQGPLGRAMRLAEIENVIDAFAAAAARAAQAGFDAVQVHAAHGYLLSQFLSPFFNKRSDAYGGSLENRARLLLQVVARVREATGDQIPLLVKLNTDDLLPGGFSTDDMLSTCAMLEGTGVDAIELSGGTTMALLMGKPESSYAHTGAARLYWRQAAERYRAEIDVPLMLVGGIRSLAVAEELVASGLADYVSLCRPLIRQPDLVRRWQAGDAEAADCISCNSCFTPGIQGQGVHCAHTSGEKPVAESG
jgi:2,4-dienoyl-CoA reductase-like NADH-dependent reductase (Old Yellow Enzyme family)